MSLSLTGRQGNSSVGASQGRDESAATPKPPKVTRVARVLPGIVEADAAYTMSEFSARLNLKRWGLREMRRAGLPVRRFHGRTFVLGSDFLQFLERLPIDE
jgi:hypothetical protein